MKWKDLERSKEPWDWKRILDRLTITPEKLNVHLQNEIDKQKQKEKG